VDHFLFWTKQLGAIWLAAFSVHLAAYVVMTAIIIYAYRYFWNRGLSKYKIQKREATAADIRREIKSSLGTVLVFSVIYSGVYLGAQAKIFTIYLWIQPLGVGYMLGSIVAMIVAHDAYFYWTHRLVHHRRLFLRFHRTHHQSVTPTAYCAYAFDVPEAIMHGLFQPIWLLFVPMQVSGLWIALTLMLARNALGHSGVELFSHGTGRSRWFGWLVTNTDHDLHHERFHYNFGFYFVWWDRLMGTEYPGSQDQVRGRPVPAAIDNPAIPPSAEISF
jgi:Delta7-sterol 5-desaturase